MKGQGIRQKMALYYRKLSLRRKALFLYLLWGIAFTIPLAVASSMLLGRYQLDRSKTALEQDLARATGQINSSISQLDAVSDYIFNNNAIQLALNDSYTDNYFAMYLALEDTLIPQTLTYQFLSDKIASIRLYTDCGLPSYKKTVYPLDTLQLFDWYGDVVGKNSICWIGRGAPDAPELLSVRMFSRNSTKRMHSYLCLDIRYEDFFRPLAALAGEDSGAIVTVAGSGSLVFSSGAPTVDAMEELSVASLLDNGWSVSLYRTKSSFTEEFRPLLLIIWVVISSLVAASLVGVYFISGTIIRPIEKLSGRVRTRTGSLSHKPLYTTRTDEIGTLTNDFNELIQTVYEDQLRIDEYRLKALYAQINPHFLYNALGLINNKAILCGAGEIGQMARLLSQFYRSSLNQGKETNTAGGELTNIRLYIEIQQLTYDRRFSISYSIDEDLLNLPVPNFILQPVIENAIEHGFQDCRRDDKRLSIALRRMGEDAAFIVADNGVGMKPETLSSILSAGSEGVGLSNIDGRLRIFYGEGYGLGIESEWGVGTTVTLRLRVGET